MAITTGAFLKDMMPFIGEWFGNEYKDYDPEFSKIFAVSKASGRFVTDPLLSGLDLAKVKNEGDAVEYDNMKQGYESRYEMVTYATGITVTREMIEDAQTLDVIEMGTREIKRNILKTQETVAALILDRSQTSGYNGGDGVTLGSASHPTTAGNKSNVPSVNVALSEAGIEQAIIDIADFRNDRGLKSKFLATDLIIPTALQFTAARILRGDLRVATADNDINALKALDILQSKPIVSHYVTNTTAWYLKTNCPQGLKFFVRREAEVGQENEFDTENGRVKGTVRFQCGWTDWRGIYCVAGL